MHREVGSGGIAVKESVAVIDGVSQACSRLSGAPSEESSITWKFIASEKSWRQDSPPKLCPGNLEPQRKSLDSFAAPLYILDITPRLRRYKVDLQYGYG